VNEPVWLTPDIVLDLHAEQLALFGGPDGLRDAGLLESALARPKNQYAYKDADLASQGAAYAFGIARNHPFVDGNKRTAFASMLVFLGLNDVDFLVAEAEATAVFLSLGAGELEEHALADWIRKKV
jgi:death-on-curing protein